MSAFESIRAIAAAENLPAYMDQYIPEHHREGKHARYMTYNLVDARGALFGADTGQESVMSMQVHVYIPATVEYIAMTRRIRQALSDAGFTWPVVTVMIDEDHRLRHIIFECEIEEE